MSKCCPTAFESEPEPQHSPVAGSSRGLTSPPGTSPLLVSSLPDIPLSGTPLVACLFSHLLAMP